MKNVYPYLRYIVAALVLTLSFGSLSGAVLWYNRSAAFDMPNMLATEYGSYIREGVEPSALQMEPVLIKSSYAPFIIVSDKTGKPVAGSANLDTQLPSLPKGVVEHATAKKNHAVVWSPIEDKQFATVTVKAGNYYVTAGQSLERVQQRCQQLVSITAIGFLLIAALLTAYVVRNKQISWHKSLLKKMKK